MDRAAQWKKVQEAENKGLPKTAIKELEPIIAEAIQEKAYAEAIRAVCSKIAYEGQIEGRKSEEKIVRLEAAIKDAPEEMRPAMRLILANWYWEYFQQNNWRFLQRTQMANSDEKDLTTWDLPRIFQEIDKQYRAALANDKDLKNTPIADYSELFGDGFMQSKKQNFTAADNYRPTLYDVMVHEALNFYRSPEQGMAQPDDAFEPEAGGPIFGSIEEFIAWKPETSDETSRTLRAIQLYQSLLAFHKDDADKSALISADLDRLEFAHGFSFGEEKDGRYKAALSQYIDAWKDHELSAQARFLLASQLQEEEEFVEAVKVAEVGAKQFPDSPGGINCANLITSIQAPQLSVGIERVLNRPVAPMQVRYKNIEKVHFRAYKADWEARLQGPNRYRPEQLMNNEQREFLNRKADVEWSADLPATEDYQFRTESVNTPKTLSPGFYFLFASSGDNFQDNGPPIFFSNFWVSDLAMVIRNQPNGNDGFVLDAESGEPIADATVKTWSRLPRGQFAQGPDLKTDNDGRFVFQGNQNTGHVALAIHGGQKLAAANDLYNQGSFGPRPYTRAVLFTDRSIYRPGQTVRYKAILISVNEGNKNYQVVPNQQASVRFIDPNGKNIERMEVKSNQFGSFSGSFTAPRDRLTGGMTILVEGNARGSTQVSVEEYKRPQFIVEMSAPKEAAKLNGEVNLTGKAIAYTGSAVGGAKVRYRVTRKVRFPDWWGIYYWWRMPFVQQDAQEIAHGFTATENDGSFTITFPAKPDRKVEEKDEPVFSYTVTAEVTDSTGETRTAEQIVRVGYTALAAKLAANDWQIADQAKLSVTTETHDGEGQAAKGSVKIYQLKQPEKVERPELIDLENDNQFGMPRPGRGRAFRPAPPGQQMPEANTLEWELGEVALEVPFETKPNGKAELEVKLPAGAYRAVLETEDRFEKAVTAKHDLIVFDPSAKQFQVKLPNKVAAKTWKLEPGEEFIALWGTGYDKGRAYVEVEKDGELLQKFWTAADSTQSQIRQQITEEMRGGVTFRVTYVRENRAYVTQRPVTVPWTNKELNIKWERFVSKLEPGQKETYTAVITGHDAKKVAAEMVATMYDASLDAYRAHDWQSSFSVFHQRTRMIQSGFENRPMPAYQTAGGWNTRMKPAKPISYRSLPYSLQYLQYTRGGNLGIDGGVVGITGGGGMPMMQRGGPPMANRAMTEGGEAMAEADAAFAGAAKAAPAPGAGFGGADEAEGGSLSEPSVDLDGIQARANLNETAFFFPHLVSDNDGEVRMEFTMPEALTKWKVMAFAHDQNLRAGLITGEAVTAKDLMVQPNPPRFLREGDTLELTVKISNQSEDRQVGTARLSLSDALTGKPIDVELGNTTTQLGFDVPKQESRTLSWRITVPDGQGPIIYKVVGGTDKLSDGEEGMLPVLSRRIYVTESLPLPIRGKESKKFDFAKLRESAESDTLRSEALTVQMTSNPSWYAIQALPYLMEFPHECSEQTFSRLYANALAHHIANSDPKIRRVFDQWKNTPALDSPLEKNQDLKSVLLDETPWVRDAQKESQARRNVGILFDDTRLMDETGRLMMKLANMQHQDGAWPWFPGGPSNDYITLYITTGYGRLRHLGVQSVDPSPALRSLNRLDAFADKMYRDILKFRKDKDENHLTPTVAMYLYGRSFFLKDKPVAKQHQEALNYWLGQAEKYWLKLSNRQSKAHVAIGLKRFGNEKAAQAIVDSIREHAVTDEEMGMFWRDTELHFAWYRAPIETQAMMIELFDEVAKDPKAVEECKIWLLKQKQTRDWKTTKATADAVYGLMLRGDNLLKSYALVEIVVGGEPVIPDAVEAGTGFFEQKFIRSEIQPEMGQIEVTKSDAGIAWGSVHWQYLEDVSKVTPHEGTPLKLEKKVFKRVLTKAGPKLEPIEGSVQVGDELIVRVVLRTDRDMEYVHLKDHRGSGTEPVNVLSKYKYQDGLGYYEATRDTSTDFFIDYLPKGNYVFEYPVRVQHRGKYPTGLASVQCMYAPEFNSHSESIMLEAK